tara:strand:+ start:2418 stop:3080 length:663 start_codon:yes stop_codon:yes gene_type:complete
MKTRADEMMEHILIWFKISNTVGIHPLKFWEIWSGFNNDEDLNSMNLESYVKKYKKNNLGGDEVATLDPSKYSLEWHKGGKGRVHNHCEFYVDTNYGIELHYESRGEAFLGFEIEGDLTLRIEQIQSRKLGRRNPGLYPLKWERMLLNLFGNWAKEKGFQKIKVQSAEDNYWYDYPSGINGNRAIERHRRRLKMRYNTTAKRNGFKYDPEERIYSLDLDN